ncbi:MAG: HAMP domain-containing sensor histidine kinase [Vicinamibacterales bacterium]
MATSSPKRSFIWQRSLYWRSVIGLSICIAAVLAVQVGAVVIWLRSAPDQTRLSAFTHGVAAELADELTAQPSLDVAAYITQHYPNPYATLYIITSADRKVILQGPLKPSDINIQGALEYWTANPNPDALPESWMSGPYQTAPIVVHGRIVGGVGGIVIDSWRQLIGWKMALLSGGLLLFATGLVSYVVFGAMRRRLENIERAAIGIGAGDFASRADESGSDELTAVARAFNQMAADLAARDEQLKVSDRTRRLLLADVSHELMTPLTAVRAYREVLSMHRVARDPEVAHSLGVIGDETHRHERIIGDLLDLARLEAGGDVLRREDVSVEYLIGRVAARHEPTARMRGVTVSTYVAPGAELLYGDTLRLEQALQNLAANAIRHTPSGGNVIVCAELRDDTVVLSVRDSGHGIPAEHLPFVFDRFYKVDPARAGDRVAGSGLGLSIVKAIVERHGGSVSASSVPGVSTEFAIHLPVTAAA